MKKPPVGVNSFCNLIVFIDSSKEQTIVWVSFIILCADMIKTFAEIEFFLLL